MKHFHEFISAQISTRLSPRPRYDGASACNVVMLVSQDHYDAVHKVCFSDGNAHKMSTMAAIKKSVARDSRLDKVFHCVLVGKSEKEII
ncbi:hypothetical protein BgiBS90_001279 [Biomphalaria glabrata]|nr:hypothetical protein BgiMline_010997 [Biomphalaria glabrata]KAI8798976.1 hypothetical protein BgiBS90_001279 [Biomphalaria glabrata]